MPAPSPDALELIQSLKTLLKEDFSSSPLFASMEDAQYFRSRFKKESTPPAPQAVIPLPIAPPPPPPAPPQPVAIEVPIPAKPAPPPVQMAPPPSPERKPPKIEGELDFRSIREILQKVAPEFRIINEIPSDADAKKIASRWKTKNQTAPITILSFQEPPEQRALLEQIAKAIDVYFGPARLIAAEPIEKEKQWEAFLSVSDLKLTIACDYSLWQLNGLMQFYKETPAQSTRALGNVPLFLLPDLSLYLKDPLLKRSLWKALCQKLSS